MKITLQLAAVRLRRIPRREFNQSIIRLRTPQQAAGNALAIAVQNQDLLNLTPIHDDIFSFSEICMGAINLDSVEYNRSSHHACIIGKRMEIGNGRNAIFL